MLLEWMRERRRRKWLARPFPALWEEVLSSNVAHYGALEAEEVSRLHGFIQVFVAEKNWEGCGGLELTDEIRVTISAQVGLLVLGLPHQYFRNVQSILIYPSTIRTPERRLQAFEIPRNVAQAGVPILGEAQLRGPVLIVWDEAKRNARHPERGHDVVYHEFAHKLDMLDGAADGTPPLDSREALNRWVEVCGREFGELRDRVARNEATSLRAYGATNEAEFFAVATEQFFNRPAEMLREEPELYGILRDFYRQDTAARLQPGTR